MIPRWPRTCTMMILLLLGVIATFGTRTSAFVAPSTSASFLSRGPTQTTLHVSSPLLEEPKSTIATTILTTKNVADSVLQQDQSNNDAEEQFQKGFTTIGFITLLNASLAPIWHTAFAGGGPPPLLLNAVISLTALTGLLVGGPLLDKSVDKMSALAKDTETKKWSRQSFRGGMELGLWKGLGTTCHIYGLALTTANHGAFFLQLTTLIVPVLQGLQGERIPRQIQAAVALALAGIFAFSQDPGGASTAIPPDMMLGDALCVGAAVFYSVYDIQTFHWGKSIPRDELVTIKVGFQALLSCLLCAAVASGDVMDYLVHQDPNWSVVVPTILWSGLFVNALATFLQVGGMQAVGPTRAQTIFASQPLWAAGLNFVCLGEILGTQGMVGGAAFLAALFLAATAEVPRPEAATESK